MFHKTHWTNERWLVSDGTSFLEYFSQSHRYASKLRSIIWIQLPPSQHDHYQKKRIQEFLQPLLLYTTSTEKKINSFHDYFTLLNYSKSRCMKYMLWKQVKLKAFHLGNEDKGIWMNSPNSLRTYLLDGWWLKLCRYWAIKTEKWNKALSSPNMSIFSKSYI